MTDTKTPGTEPDNNEGLKQPSDARIILGPLVKYAAMGFVIVSIIITTAVMLDHQFNDIDREVAELEAQLAQARKDTADELDTESTTELKEGTTPAVETVAIQQEPVISEPVVVSEAEKPVVSVVDNNVAAAPQVAQPAAQPLETVTNTAETTATEELVTADAVVETVNNSHDSFDKSLDEIMAERNTYLKERDRVYLEEFKANQEKQLQYMRERLVRQEKRIEQMEKRNQEIYDYRAANVKEMQQKRESFLDDRI
jgi:hypothetical protein